MEKPKRIIRDIHHKAKPFIHKTHTLIHKGHARSKKIPMTAWVYIIAGICVLCVAGIIAWGVILNIPDISHFETRKVAQSIDIYDRNNKKIYSTGGDITRIIVASEDISEYSKKAAVAAEDARFYKHKGIVVSSTVRAIIFTLLAKANIYNGPIQGGSTITQQVIKNTLLTQDRTVVRKIKEWILALKIEKRYSKDAIMTSYLNEVPFGGRLYGIRAGSEAFFGKQPKDITLAEAAYLAAIPNAPSYLSPYGKHVDALENRKKYVLRRMHELGLISEKEYFDAQAEKVVFKDSPERSSHAIHFVEYVLSLLSDSIDEARIERGGLHVYTTLDLDLQNKAEEIIRAHALASETEWNASNAGLVAIDPQNGDIIAMVGSRGYTDNAIDGKFNIALAKRQPGSAFKPFIYATAFEEGFTPETVLFDTQTQFGTDCPPNSMSSVMPCYAPDNYDGVFKGPVSLRNALAQSRNVPAVKLFYITGTSTALAKAKAMGISTLENINQYGLTLVLGGGEVTLLDMVSAYGTFANDGTHVSHRAITRIEDEKGTVIATVESHGEEVLAPEAARLLNDVLSDNEARTPLFGAHSGLYFEGRPVAAKTGTTNSNKDAWLIGYTPRLVVGVWSGNNDNTPMKKGSAINIQPWRSFFDSAFEKFPYASFIAPAPVRFDTKPILRGIWQGGETFVIDTISGGKATEFTPEETKKEIAIPNPHDILHWIRRGDPLGTAPTNPASDMQYARFEYGAQAWIRAHPEAVQTTQPPTFFDSVHTQNTLPKIEDMSCLFDAVNTVIDCSASIRHSRPLQNLTVFINDTKALTHPTTNDTVTVSIPVFDFVPEETTSVSVRFIAKDVVYSSDEEQLLVTLQ